MLQKTLPGRNLSVRRRTEPRRLKNSSRPRCRSPHNPEALAECPAQLAEDMEPPMTPAVGVRRMQTGWWARKLRASPYRRVVGAGTVAFGLMGMAGLAFQRSPSAIAVAIVGALLVGAGLRLLRRSGR